MHFGPAGNGELFYNQGHKSSLEAPKWLQEQGLSAYEIPCGRGVRISQKTAEALGQEAKEHNISISVHAPYFINLANPDPEKRENSFRYILEASRLASWAGGERVVLHTGAMMKLEREEALANCRNGLLEAYRRLDAEGLSQICLCPETMGKKSQIGDLQEILDFCLLDERLLPCVDFAHLHALTGGGFGTEEAFTQALDQIEEALGAERAHLMHMHFSTIEYTAAGEKRHRTFAEADYGPRFENLGPLLRERGYCGTVICECAGTQVEDAMAMRDIFTKSLEKM